MLEQTREELRIAISTAATDGLGTINYNDLINELNKQFTETGYSRLCSL